MIRPGDVPSVHAGLRYGYFFFVLTSFQLLVGIEGNRLICTLERKKVSVHGMGWNRQTRADRLDATESLTLF